MLSSLPSHLLQQLGLSHEILENELSKFMNVEEMKVSVDLVAHLVFPHKLSPIF